MKKNVLKNIIGAGFVGSLMLFSPFPQAEAGIVTDRFPIQMYVDRQLSTYNRAGDSSRAGWADANNDLIRVYSVSNGWARISHPGSGGRTVNRYCRVNDLFADPNYSNRSVRVKGAQTAYRTSSGNATIGSVSNNEEVIVLADNGRRAQIIYRLNNGTGYKVGWVPSSAVTASVPTPADGRMKGDVNGDGKVDRNDLDLLQRYQIGLVDSVPCPKNADVNGDGRITLTDISRLEIMLKGDIKVKTIKDGWYNIRPAHDQSRSLDSYGPNNNLHMWENISNPQQKFYLQNRGNGYFSLKSGGNGLYITAAGRGRGANLMMRAWNGSDEQLFRLVDGGVVGGKQTYHIMSKVGSNLEFDCAGGNKQNYTNAQLWTHENTNWHKWTFTTPQESNSNGLIVNHSYDVNVSPKSKENRPHYENKSGNRNRNSYNTVIDQFNVTSNNRYRRTASATYCNIFAWDVMSAMNVVLPHWIKNNVPANSTTKGANEINVNSTCVWMNNYAQQYGWRKINALEAQNRANSGYPTIAIWKNPSGKSGHIAVVRPEGNGYSYSSNKGPVIAQAGASNYSRANVSGGFGSSKMSSIVYWTHD